MCATIGRPSGGPCPGPPALASRPSRRGNSRSISRLGLQESGRRLIVSPLWNPCSPNCRPRLANTFRSVRKDLSSPTLLGSRVDAGAGGYVPLGRLISLFAALSILQNDTAPLVTGNSPLFDLLQRSEAAETGQVIVEAAVSHAWRLSRAVGITHLRRRPLRGFQI